MRFINPQTQFVNYIFSLRQHLTLTHFLPKYWLNPSYTKLLTKMVDWPTFKIVLVNGFSTWEGVIRPRRTVKVPSTSDFARRGKFLCFTKIFSFFWISLKKLEFKSEVYLHMKSREGNVHYYSDRQCLTSFLPHFKSFLPHIHFYKN